MTTSTTAASTPKSMRGSRITIDGVGKVFGTDTTKPFEALTPTSIDIAPGEFVSVVGPSGCGKSTLMLMAAGLLSTSSGSISIDGAPIDGPIHDVGIAFQDHLLLDFRSAMDNVLLQADVRKLDKKLIRDRAEQLFERLGLSAAADRYPAELSGGMRQRVSLVRSLVHEPSILLMDEPFGALDALTRLQVRFDLEKLWMEERPTVIFITHSVEEAVGLADRVIVMSPSPGRVVDEIQIDLPRPRPLELGEAPELAAYAKRIYDHFDRLGVIDRSGFAGH